MTITNGRAVSLFALLSLCSTCPADSFAADTPPSTATVHVGDGTMNGSIISEYDNVWLVTVKYFDGRVDERGLSSDHVRFRTIAGKRYLTRTEGTTSVLGKPGESPTSNFEMSFNVFDPVSMRPVLGEAYTSAGDSEVNHFDANHVSTHTRQKMGAPDSVVQTDTAEPVFDVHGGMTGLLLAALPLKTGYSAVLPGLADNALDTTAIRVVGEEEISAGRWGKMKTWVIEIGPRPAASTYWISKRPPYVIRATVKASNAVASWDIL